MENCLLRLAACLSVAKTATLSLRYLSNNSDICTRASMRLRSGGPRVSSSTVSSWMIHVSSDWKHSSQHPRPLTVILHPRVSIACMIYVNYLGTILSIRHGVLTSQTTCAKVSRISYQALTSSAAMLTQHPSMFREQVVITLPTGSNMFMLRLFPTSTFTFSALILQHA
jgi:hypothetical protein